jgi:hypothetical protein
VIGFFVRGVIGVVTLAAVLYIGFVRDFGGQTLWSHCMEVWGSPVVQKKVELVKEGAKSQVQDELVKANESVREHFDASDRRKLEEILGKKK